jgi:hypothetical protein
MGTALPILFEIGTLKRPILRRALGSEMSQVTTTRWLPM